eukprot:UN06282
MDMRVGAFDRSMFPTYGKNMESVSSIPKFFLASRKLRELKIFRLRNRKFQIFLMSKIMKIFFKMFKNDLGQ